MGPAKPEIGNDKERNPRGAAGPKIREIVKPESSRQLGDSQALGKREIERERERLMKVIFLKRVKEREKE